MTRWSKLRYSLCRRLRKVSLKLSSARQKYCFFKFNLIWIWIVSSCKERLLEEPLGKSNRLRTPTSFFRSWINQSFRCNISYFLWLGESRILKLCWWFCSRKHKEHPQLQRKVRLGFKSSLWNEVLKCTLALQESAWKLQLCSRFHNSMWRMSITFLTRAQMLL